MKRSDKKNNLQMIAKLLISSTQIPVVWTQQDKTLWGQVKGYVSQGRLKTNELLFEMKNDLIAHLSYQSKRLLGGLDHKTYVAILDTGAIHINTPDRDDFIQFKKQRLLTGWMVLLVDYRSKGVALSDMSY